MKNAPVAWMMVNRENTSAYLTFEKPTRDMKISHQPTPLYTHPVKELDEQFKKGFEAGKEEGWKAHKFHHPAELTDEFRIKELESEIERLQDQLNEFLVARDLAILRKANEK